NVIGIKESILNLREAAAHMEGCPDKLFFSATALNLTQYLKLGGHGVMCPEALILPKLTSECYASARAGNWGQARRQQEELFAVAPLDRRSPTTPALTRAFLRNAYDHQLHIPFRNEPSSVRLKEALNYIHVPTPTYAKPGRESLTNYDAHQVRRIM